MAGIVGLVAAISADVVAKMAAAGMAPLVDGQIVLGKSKAAENTTPPRVVFIPKSFRFGPPSAAVNSQPLSSVNANAPGSAVRSCKMTIYGGGYVGASTTVTFSAPDVSGGVTATATAVVTTTGAVSSIIMQSSGSGYLKPPTVTIGGVGTGALASANLAPTPSALIVGAARSIYTEWHMFEVHVWGCLSTGGVITPSSDQDYDATQQIYQQVIASTQSIAAGVHMPSAGNWFDAEDDATVTDVLGHKARFMLELATPLLSEPMVPTSGASVQYAPPQTQPNPTLTMQPIAGTTPNP